MKPANDNALHRPNQCVIVAVDTARNSGHATFSCGVRIASGEVNISDAHRLDIILNAAISCAHGLPVVLVLERAFGGPRGTLLGLGAARFAWVEAWKRVNNLKTARRVVSFYPQEWRARLGIKGKIENAAVRAAMLKAHGLNYLTRDVGPDECEALFLGRVATFSARVAAVLPKKYRDAA